MPQPLRPSDPNWRPAAPAPDSEWSGLKATLVQRQALEAMQGIYRQGHPNETTVPHPSMFQRDPLVIGGGATLAQQARRLLDLDPVTKSRAGNITYGPTHASILDEGNARFGGAMGETDAQNNIGLHQQPYEDQDPTYSTLAHELAHVAGHDEPGARQANELSNAKLRPFEQEMRAILARKARLQAGEDRATQFGAAPQERDDEAGKIINKDLLSGPTSGQGARLVPRR